MRNKVQTKHQQFQHKQFKQKQSQQRKVDSAAKRSQYDRKKKFLLASRKCRNRNFEDLRQQTEIVNSLMIEIFPRETAQRLTLDWATCVILEWLDSSNFDELDLWAFDCVEQENLSQHLNEIFGKTRANRVSWRILLEVYGRKMRYYVLDGWAKLSYSL